MENFGDFYWEAEVDVGQTTIQMDYQPPNTKDIAAPFSCFGPGKKQGLDSRHDHHLRCSYHR